MNNELEALAGSVPIPNRLFDEVLPFLSDTELRLLLVVYRATRGWREGAEAGGWRHKRRDWISHSQLLRRTGRRSEAVSNAIQGLIDRGLLVVENEGGVALSTRPERQLSMSRLYFRPVDNPPKVWTTARSARTRKPKTTTYTQDNIERGHRAYAMRTRRNTPGMAHISSLLPPFTRR